MTTLWVVREFAGKDQLPDPGSSSQQVMGAPAAVTWLQADSCCCIPDYCFFSHLLSGCIYRFLSLTPALIVFRVGYIPGTSQTKPKDTRVGGRPADEVMSQFLTKTRASAKGKPQHHQLPVWNKQESRWDTGIPHKYDFIMVRCIAYLLAFAHAITIHDAELLQKFCAAHTSSHLFSGRVRCLLCNIHRGSFRVVVRELTSPVDSCRAHSAHRS